MNIPELLQKIAKGLNETSTKCNKITLSVDDNGIALCRLHISDPQLLDPVLFSKESGLPMESVHIPESILTENDKSFRVNIDYITIKI
jgi:hypothetical protein